MATRAEVIYRGEVQGVGFRYTARAMARSFPVQGFVKNLTDGTVQVVAEGEPREVEAFLARLSDRMRAFIVSAEVKWLEASGEYSGFEVGF